MTNTKEDQRRLFARVLWPLVLMAGWAWFWREWFYFEDGWMAFLHFLWPIYPVMRWPGGES